MPVSPITPREAKARLDAKDASFVLVDCRDAEELAIVKVEGAIHLPMMEVPTRMGELDKAKEIAVLCHHGVRSGQVAAFLARMGFPRVHNVAGGIDRWAVELDPSLARY